jgi:Tol biopolymer transport system component
LIEGIKTAISFAPDGKRFTFVRAYPGQGEEALMVANEDGSGERKLATRKQPDAFTHFPYQGPSWSPDGNVIACPYRSFVGGFHWGVIGVAVGDGAERPITSKGWPLVGDVAWLSDGSGLVMSARDRIAGPGQLWHLSYPGGEARTITNDLIDYDGVSLTADSGSVVAVQSDRYSNIWIMADGDPGRAKQITPDILKEDGSGGLSWTPDGQIVFASNASGNWDIWIMGADGSNRRQLTFDADTDMAPSVSPDGRYIVFVSYRAGSPNVWRMDLDGGDQRQLTSGSRDAFPCVSADGRWVIYTAASPREFILWKVLIEGGDPVQLTDKLSSSPAISPDGNWVACNYQDETDSKWKVATIAFAGDKPTKVFDVPSFPQNIIRWTPDGRALTYNRTQGGVSNIWILQTDGAESKQLSHFKSDRTFYFDWSRDGKLICSRGGLITDVVLITDIK